MSDSYEEWQREYDRLRENEDYVPPSQLARDVFEMNRRNRELSDTRFINRALQGPGRRPQGPARRPMTRRVTQPYQRDARAEPQPRRLAFEIHDFMEKIDLDKLNDFLSRIIRLDERQIRYYDENIKEFIEEKLSEIVQTSELEKFMRDINTIKTRIRSIKLNKKIKLSIIYSLLFVANQPREYKQLYVESFFKDCLEAYNRNSRSSSQDTLSCAKGVIERLITSMMAGGISRPDDETYIRINNILTAKKIEQRIKEFGEKWLKDNSTPKNKEEEPTFEKMRNALLNEFEERDVDIYMEAYRDFPWSDFEASARRKARKTRRRRKSYKNKFIKI
jgi:hypothetical protein